MSTTQPWPAPLARGPLDSSVVVPASKSLMARALVLAALAEDATTVHNPLVADDSLLMAEALRALGSVVNAPPAGPWLVLPGTSDTDARVSCGLSGTVMRFVPPMAALGAADTWFDGDPRARKRPMRALLDALRSLGVRTTPPDATQLPFRVTGGSAPRGGTVTIDASESSQYVSALLMTGCRLTDGLTVRTNGAPPSAPHIEMTVQSLRRRGVDAAALGPDGWHVPESVPAGGEVTIEPDLSNAAPFLAAAVVTAGRVHVPGWPAGSSQPGAVLLDLLSRFGATVAVDQSGATVTGSDEVRGLGTVDLGEVGELTPTVAAIAATAHGATTITGVAHLRGHETDRLAALARALHELGGHAVETPDGLHIEPGRLHRGVVRSEGDHRMATFAAIIGLVVPGVVVDDVAVTAKTMPTFPSLWHGMLR